MKNFILLFFTFTFLIIFSNSGLSSKKGNTSFQSFNKAKKTLLKQVYNDHRVTFYCDCEFAPNKKLSNSNGYIPKNECKRSQRIEWEHIVPAQAFGQSFEEWRDGNPECVDKQGRNFKGRNCARKASLKFRYMESDLYNLVPAVGEINGLRSNYSFAMIIGERRDFGTCDMEIEDRKAEPPTEVRGDIARTYYYMQWAYSVPGIVSKKNRKLFESWDNFDPVDAWECKRTRRIEKIQGNENPIVKNACMEIHLW